MPRLMRLLVALTAAAVAIALWRWLDRTGAPSMPGATRPSDGAAPSQYWRRGPHAAYLDAPGGTELGCYVDRPLLRDLTSSVAQLDLSNLSPDSVAGACAAHCAAEKTLFAGLGHDGWCWCGDMPMQHGPSSSCDGEDAEHHALRLVRTSLAQPSFAVASTTVIASLCTRGFSCTDVFTASARAYASRHATDLLIQTVLLEPGLPGAYTKLVVLWRLLRMRAHTWIWWLDCDALFLASNVAPQTLVAEVGGDDPSVLLWAHTRSGAGLTNLTRSTRGPSSFEACRRPPNACSASGERTRCDTARTRCGSRWGSTGCCCPKTCPARRAGRC